MAESDIMGRGIYDNSYNRNRTRIDTRPQSDPAVASGMRNIHRDTDGSVISATTPEGQRVNSGGGQSLLGSRFRPSRLDAGPQTPRLDAMGTDPSVGMSRTDRRAHFAKVSQDGAIAGKFGAGAQRKAVNLDGRQSLFRDMAKVGAGGVTPQMRERAKSLGVDDKQWNNGMSKLQAAPAAIAAPNASAAGAIPTSLALSPGMKPAGPPAPTGAAKARADVAQKGLWGAVESAVAEQNADKARRDSSAAMAQKVASSKSPKSARPMPEPKAAKKTDWIAMDASYASGGSARKSKFAGGSGLVTPAKATPAVTPATSAPAAPMSLKDAYIADVKDRVNTAVNSGKAVAGFVKSSAVGTARAMDSAQSASLNAAESAQKFVMNAGSKVAASSLRAATGMIPGNTGQVIRDMNIPDKMENTMRKAGEKFRNSNLNPVKAVSRFRTAM